MPFTVLALGACLLMTRIAARPARRPADRPAGHRARASLIGLGGADPQRGGLARPRLGRSSPGGIRGARPRDAGPADRRRRDRGRARLRCRGRSATGSSFGSPLPGQAADQRAVASPASTSSPGTTRRPCRATWRSGRRGCSSCGSRASATTCSTSCSCPGLPISLIGLARRCRGQVRGAALRPVVIVSFITFLVTSLRLPGGDDVGHVPARRRPGPRPARPVGAARARRLIARVGARRGWTRPVAWLGPLLGIFGSLLFSVVLLPTFGAGSRDDRGALRGAGRPDGRDRPPARRQRRPGHHQLPDLAGRDAADPGPGPPRRTADATSSTWRTIPLRRDTLVVLIDADSTHWPDDLDAGVDGRRLLPRTRPRAVDPRPAPTTRSPESAHSRSSAREPTPILKFPWSQHAP